MTKDISLPRYHGAWTRVPMTSWPVAVDAGEIVRIDPDGSVYRSNTYIEGEGASHTVECDWEYKGLIDLTSEITFQLAALAVNWRDSAYMESIPDLVRPVIDWAAQDMRTMYETGPWGYDESIPLHQRGEVRVRTIREWLKNHSGWFPPCPFNNVPWLEAKWKYLVETALIYSHGVEEPLYYPEKYKS